MSNITIASLPRISNVELSSKLLSTSDTSSKDATAGAPSSIAIIDVRDSDYIGGHIKGCTNVPSSTLDYKIPELVRTLKDKELVVFHCALSQQRGPSAALRYVRERARLLDITEEGEEKQMKGEGAADGTNKENKAVQKKGQQVAVLEGGFVKWQEK